jgi:heme/copper-type cytochrome/quinol oxidase subunit 4
MLKFKILGSIGFLALLASGLFPFYFLMCGKLLDFTVYFICSILGVFYVVLSLFSFFKLKLFSGEEGNGFFYLPYSTVAIFVIRSAGLLMLIFILQMKQIELYALIPVCSAYFLFFVLRFFLCVKHRFFSLSFLSDTLSFGGISTRKILFSDIKDISQAHSCFYLILNNGSAYTIDPRFVTEKDRLSLQQNLLVFMQNYKTL